MSLLQEWKLRGPVRTIRAELSEWDLSKEQLQAPCRVTVTQFRRDGCISEMEDYRPNGPISRWKYSYDDAGRLLESAFQQNDGPIATTVHRYDKLGRLVQKIFRDGSGTERESEIYTYDDGGRKTKLEFVSRPENAAACGTTGCGTASVYGVEGAELAYGAEGVVTITTRYDDNERSCEALFHDENRSLILRVILTRDAAGRLIKEESLCGDHPPFSLPQALEKAPPEERAAEAAAFAQLFSPQQVMWSTTYRYDDRGRRIERCGSLCAMSRKRTVWEYDENDNPVRMFEENSVGDLKADESGNLELVNPKSFRREGRYEYKYDPHGNWTERIVLARYETNSDFQRANIERKEIDYYTSNCPRDLETL